MANREIAFAQKYASLPSVKSLFAIVATICLLGLRSRAADARGRSGTLPDLPAVLASKVDLWGEAAMRQPNGASYAFFENLLPPPRYVNADFRFYPIVLSAPRAKVKARLISNGSGVNLRGGARSWNDLGTPATFRVGPDEFRFGDILSRLAQPTLADGYLPIVNIRYRHASEAYQLEAFAATAPELADNGLVLVRFSLGSGTNGIITVQLDAKGLVFTNRTVLDSQGHALAYFDENWTWERQRAHAKISAARFATVAIPTTTLTGPLSLTSRPGNSGGAIKAFTYDEQRKLCVATWENILREGMNLECPEPLVNNAWRNLLIQNFSLIDGDHLNYSAGNQYEKMYAAETSDGAVPMMQWGYEAEMRQLLPVILDLKDKRLPNHFAGHQLDDIPRYFWQTRDTNFVQELRPRWEKELQLILTNRSSENGLMAKENYCTDIEVPVYSFPGNAACWAALRDIAPVLDDLGDPAAATRVRQSAADLKRAILAAVEKNTRRETAPPFIPMALFYGEDLHDPITHTRLGSYWDLVANYIVGSRIFVGSERELWLPRYFEQHGGLCMGLTRSAATNHTFWTGTHRTNPLYGMRYIVDCLRRDDVDRALVSFYGMLAHGMTRNTFVGAEGCSIEPVDEGGRYFYCPPNSASNGQWLTALRYLLVQDWDADEDGRPDTLRLMFGTPRKWLADGQVINLNNAPTAFGRVSVRLESQLTKNRVVAELALPDRNKAKHILLRARLPKGWKATSANIDGRVHQVDERGTVDLTGMKGKTTVRFAVEQN
jgi:hypothetical protein